MEIGIPVIFSVIITLYAVRETWKLVDTQQEVGKLLIIQATIYDVIREKNDTISHLTDFNLSLEGTVRELKVSGGISSAEIVRLKELLEYSQENVKLLERSPKRVTARNTPDEFAEMAEERYPHILKERASGKRHEEI